MPFHVVLSVEDYHSETDWRWVLRDPVGRFLADHEVRLDTKDAAYADFENLPERLERYHRGIRPVPEVLRELGDWMGTAVFGSLACKLLEYEQRPACMIQVRVPPRAQALLFRPLEIACFQGRSLAERAFRFVYTLDTPAPRTAAVKQIGILGPLRVLGIFSLPQGHDPLNLRRERYQLELLLREVSQTRSVAIEYHILQYGTTRRTLEDALSEDPGWDVIHVSGHGEACVLLLEKDDGNEDPITTDDIAKLLKPAQARLSLLTLSTCYSAAADLQAARALVGLEPEAQTPEGLTVSPAAGLAATATVRVLPGLAQHLSADLDCAVLAMRYPVLDSFATDLALALYRFLLAKNQPLPAALELALEKALEANPQGAELSRITPALFGPRAVDLRLSPPPQQPSFQLPAVGLFRFPAEPERFVGRLLPILRASQALAPRSRKTGVLFYGMVGAGKTFCALELAYRHRRKRFAAYAWHVAPQEGRDIEDALSRFAQDLETQLPELGLLGLIDDPRDFHGKVLPRLRSWLEDHSVLLVIDNIEGLLTSEGKWRDGRWGELVEALLQHEGLSRLVLTSRRPPQSLLRHSRVQVEAIHALSFAESVLLARELSHLRLLFEDAVGQTTLRRILRLTQGHPKLLGLLNCLAVDSQKLANQLEQAESAAQGRESSLAAFFEKGESDQDEETFFAELCRWTHGIAGQLTPATRLLFQFLAALEEKDRLQGLIEIVWPQFLRRLLGERGEQQSVPLPPPAGRAGGIVQSAARDALNTGKDGLRTALGRLTQAGLVEVARPPKEMEELIQSLQGQLPENAVQLADAQTLSVKMLAQATAYQVHPGVAEAARIAADPETLKAADSELADFYLADAVHGLETELRGGGRQVRSGARRAVPYLMRTERWEETGMLLERLLHRDPSPGALAFVIPRMRRALEALRGTEHELKTAGVLSRALLRAGQRPGAEIIVRESLGKCVQQGNFRLAIVWAEDLFGLLLTARRLNAALETADMIADFSAGLGPWSQLSAKVIRLQAFNAFARYREVLKAVEELHRQMAALPAKSDDVVVVPWRVREGLLVVGATAALHLELWEKALALYAAIADHMRLRGADDAELARMRFNNYRALLGLRLLPQARQLLEDCRATFEMDGDTLMLAKVYSAVGHLENVNGNPVAAARFEQVSLRYSYQTEDLEDCAVSHNNLATYLRLSGAAPETILAHRLADAVIRFQTGPDDIEDSDLKTSIRILARSPLPTAPPSFAQVSAEVERIEGVHFTMLFDTLPKRAPDGDAAIDAVWGMALEQKRQRETTLAGLPPGLREALESGDGERVRAAMQSLPSEEYQAVMAAMETVERQMGVDPEKIAEKRRRRMLRDFEPLLQAIAAAARGEEGPRREIEALLPKMEENGWRIAESVRRIWAGERDAEVITAGMDPNSAALMHHVLELVEKVSDRKPPK